LKESSIVFYFWSDSEKNENIPAWRNFSKVALGGNSNLAAPKISNTKVTTIAAKTFSDFWLKPDCPKKYFFQSIANNFFSNLIK
jgi:hypothetical protein